MGNEFPCERIVGNTMNLILLIKLALISYCGLMFIAITLSCSATDKKEIYPCPIDNPQYVSVGPKCYYFDTSPNSKQDAASICVNDINGRLWEPKRIEMMNQIHSKAMEFSKLDYWWVGVSDINEEGLFQYDSTAQTFPFTNRITPWFKD